MSDAAVDERSGPAPVPQAEVQAMLDREAEQAGLEGALRMLAGWCDSNGYFPDGVFERNDVFQFPDPEHGITFRAQINRSRLAYQAPSVVGSAVGVPACPICFSHVASVGKPLLRAYEFCLGAPGTPFFAQLTPFPLRRGHHIIILREHEPMRVDRQSADELLDFTERAPSFAACSNSDVTDAGVSIIGHHHYQMFDGMHLPVFDAAPQNGLSAERRDARIDLLDYPMTTVRVAGERDGVLAETTGLIARWKARDQGRNTCNLTARRAGSGFELYLFFRNPAHRTPPDLLRIKSEGVGVVEACGEGIYPPPADEATMDEIRTQGLSVLKRIMRGLDPIGRANRSEFFREVCVAD